MAAITRILRVLVIIITLGLPATAQPQSGPPRPGTAQTQQFGDIPLGSNKPGQLLSGPLANEAQAFEKETQQLGGSGSHSYLQVGALRCKPQDAMIGARLRRGSVVAFLQVVCTSVVCGAEACAWGDGNTPYLGTFAGDPQGGNIVENMFCSHGYVIAGFRASSTSGDGYLENIVFECARQSGQPHTAKQMLYPIVQPDMLEDTSSIAPQGTGQPPPPSEPRIWASPIDDTGKSVPEPPTKGTRISQCGQFGATGLSVAVGLWQKTPAIEAFSMFCGGSKISNHGPS